MSRVKSIVVTDIFGRTNSLLELVESLPGPVELLDPYDGETIQFSDEQQAYASFNQRMGHDRYLKKLLSRLDVLEGLYQLVGFSAGATACWRAAANESPGLLQSICIYGSQIRQHCQHHPKTPVSVILPASEPSFDVEEHAKILREIPRVSVIATNYQHGFMNKQSLNYSEQGYRETLEWLRLALTGQIS